jgi:MFS family permease
MAMIQASQTAVMFILSVLAKKQFEAGKLEVLIIQSAPTVLFVLSIFWNDLFGRRTFGRYLRTYWLVASAPMLLAPFAHNVWMLIVPYLVACLGASGHMPVAGELLKKLYPGRSLGRTYSLIWGTAMTVGALASAGVGKWLTYDAEAFRIYIPIASVVQLAGVFTLWRLAEATGLAGARRQELARRRADPVAPVEEEGVVRQLARTFRPVTNMGTVLREDPTFARYEGAYMTYGIGWMIGNALLPLLVTEGLHLQYDEVAESTQVPYLVAVVAMLLPAGWLLDRVGAVRTTGFSFFLLALYPVGLLLAGDSLELAFVSVWYGMAHAGATVGWMLGPVALAPTPQKVPTYVAIHATLVGLRGTIFQSLGVLLYWVTGGFEVPLALAAGAYVWAGVQMLTLHRRTKRAG